MMEETASQRRLRYFNQMLLALAASVSYITIGMTVTWPNVLAKTILENNSTLLGHNISLEQVHLDMSGSMMFIGSIPGYLLAGWIVSQIGRKWSIFIAALPSVTGAMLIGLAVNPQMIIVGRFLDGTTFGMMNVAVGTYIVEISDNELRGRAGCVVSLTMQIGSILSVGLGILMSWYYVALMYGCILLVHCLLVVLILPESPTYLAVIDKDERALKILSQLRGPSVDAISELKKLKTENQRAVGGSAYRALFKKNMLKRMFTIFGLFFLSNFAGVQVLKANLSRMLQAFGLPFDRDIGSVIVICILFIGSLTLMCILDFIGRRHALIISLTLIAVANAILGSFVYFSKQRPEWFEVQLNNTNCTGCNDTTIIDTQTRSEIVEGLSWIPLIAIMIAAFGQSVGAGTLPFILASEYFPTNVRSQGTSLCQLVGSLQSFATLQLFSPMRECITEAGLFWTYGAFAAVGILYTYFIIRETNGKRIG